MGTRWNAVERVPTGFMAGEPDITFYIFDRVHPGWGPSQPYCDRMDGLECNTRLGLRCRRVLPTERSSPQSLEVYEHQCLEQGFEGVMIRVPLGPYKAGRSTEHEGWLLKLKRFADSEATVITPGLTPRPKTG